MFDLFVFVLKSCCCSTLLYLLYIVAVKRYSGAQFRRIYLMSSILFSLVIPLIEMPIELRNIPNEMAIDSTLRDVTKINSIVNDSVSNIDVETLLIKTVWSIYILGIGLLIGRFLLGIKSIYFAFVSSSKQIYDGREVYLTDKAAPAFSFFNKIFLSPDVFEDKSKLPMIFEHERAHAKQWHSLDMTIANLNTIGFWFNPISYLFKREVEMNTEKLADNHAISLFDVKEYVSTLLSFKGYTKLNLVSQFVRNPINERVDHMIQKKKVKPIRQWLSLAYIMPFLGMITLLFADLFPVLNMNPVVEDCDCDHIHMTKDNNMIIVEEGPYGPVQRMID